MKKPKISVIMSVDNGMPYLKQAVESILNQTYKNFEFIIVDDASGDSSWNYLWSLKDKRIKLIKNKRNLGLAASLNTALLKAKGEYIARMDADDISLPTRFDEQINFLAKNKSIDLCGTFAQLIDEKNRKVGELKYPSIPSEIKNKLILFNPIIHPTFFARKKFFRDLNGYREEFDGAEDYELLLRGSKVFQYANLPKELFRLRLSSTRRSVHFMNKMDKLDLKIKLDFIKENGLSPLSLYAVVKKLFFLILLSPSLKVKMAKFLKKA